MAPFDGHPVAGTVEHALHDLLEDVAKRALKTGRPSLCDVAAKLMTRAHNATRARPDVGVSLLSADHRGRLMALAEKLLDIAESQTSPRSVALAGELLRTGRVCKVADATWRHAGVRQPNQELSLNQDEQIVFVARTLGRDLESRLAAALSRPGLTMLVVAGESTAGKSRLMIEALRKVGPNAWFLAPVDAAAARIVCTAELLSDGPFADSSEDAVVVWLDDLEQFVGLSGEGLTLGHLEALRNVKRPVVALCTRGGRGHALAHGDAGRMTLVDSAVACAR
jgi:hypothetical protein